jgi:hypothetical protein
MKPRYTLSQTKASTRPYYHNFLTRYFISKYVCSSNHCQYLLLINQLQIVLL